MGKPIVVSNEHHQAAMDLAEAKHQTLKVVTEEILESDPEFTKFYQSKKVTV